MLSIRIRNELILLNLFVVIFIVAIIFFPPNVLRIVLALPFLLFFPGYTFMAAVFPRKDQLDIMDRIALSFGISIAVLPLVGLILNYSPWGIRLESVLYSISSLIFATSIIAWLRRRKLPQQDRFGTDFRLGLPRLPERSLPRVLSVVLIIAILGALGVSGYSMFSPKVKEAFTEFYLAGLDGRARNYPAELKKGEAGQVIAEIVNHEKETISYRLVVIIDGLKNTEVGPIVLENGTKLEEVISFVPDKVGANLKVEFLLYRIDRPEPYRQLYFWIDVTN
ncbi:MAG: DUF1616 domain-containing protein [Chloroflexi bacterium]|nr:DUF1616 domain-containing protein [Chloroflexota bacterium]